MSMEEIAEQVGLPPPEEMPITSLLVYALVASFRTWYCLALL